MHQSIRTLIKTMKIIRHTHTALPTVSKQSRDTVTTHGNVHIVRTHTSNAQSTVYIVAGTVATLLLIAVCIVVLQITKTNKQDVCTDMQYYTGSTMNTNLAMSTIYPNTSLNQSNII